MRLTSRCRELLRLLGAARWLTTGQVRRRFFAAASVNAARRRLCKLAGNGYLRRHQGNRMQEAIFALGANGRAALAREGAAGITLERKPPKQMEHLAGINDIRIAAETAEGFAYFFAAWELPGIGWKFPMVPDAVFRIGERTFAAEYDRGLEGLRYFVGSKIAWYREGIPGLPLTGVLVVADRETRMRTLAAAIGDGTGRFFCTTLPSIRRDGLPEAMTRDAGLARETCSPGLLWRENSLAAAEIPESTGCGECAAGSSGGMT